MRILIKNADIYTPVGTSYVRGTQMKNIKTIKNSDIFIEDGVIRKISRDINLPYDKLIDANHNAVIPGFVDSHTHLVYPTERIDEYEWKLQGISYTEIAKRGGGILNTARKTAQTTEEKLYQDAYNRAIELIKTGTTTIEIKSGYGLLPEQELKLLRVANKLKQTLPQKVVVTYLALHALPEEFKNKREEYIRIIVDEVLPLVAEKELADFVDAFCETGFFSVEESRKVLQKAKELNFKLKLHANELDYSGGVQLGVELSATSVDHLECVGEAELNALKNGSTIATLLPATSFFLNLNPAPARKIIDNDIPVAIASDFNPGTSPTGNMQLVMAIACSQLRMLPAEALTSATLNSASALNLSSSVGSIQEGKLAHILILKTPDYRFIPYYFGKNWIQKVILGENIIEVNC